MEPLIMLLMMVLMTTHQELVLVKKELLTLSHCLQKRGREVTSKNYAVNDNLLLLSNIQEHDAHDLVEKSYLQRQRANS